MINSIAPMQPSQRQIIREEIKRQKELDKIDLQHENGEISDFSHYAQKAILNLPIYNCDPTICYMA